jgi:hypothetical protein
VNRSITVFVSAWTLAILLVSASPGICSFTRIDHAHVASDPQYCWPSVNGNQCVDGQDVAGQLYKNTDLTPMEPMEKSSVESISMV